MSESDLLGANHRGELKFSSPRLGLSSGVWRPWSRVAAWFWRAVQLLGTTDY